MRNFSVILRGICYGLLAFVGIEIASGVLSVLVRIAEQYTHWFYLGEETNNWLGVLFLYWGIFPAAFCGLVVCAGTVRNGWNK